MPGPSIVPSVLLISGPTASGKSGLAVQLALRLNGEIVNIDSVQVYRGADIGAAKITETERLGVPHHLLDIIDPEAVWDVQQHCQAVQAACIAIRSRGNLPILVGGGGLYVTALFCGLSQLPQRDVALREELEQYPSEFLYHRLSSIDPQAAARLHVNDRQRVIRAIEACEVGGVAQSESFASRGEPFVRGVGLVLEPVRTMLYAQINARVDTMFEQGLEAEARALLPRCSDNPLRKAIGYSQLRDFLEGGCSLAQVLEIIKRDTRRFAKRQVTYWRNEPEKRGWVRHEYRSDVAEWIKTSLREVPGTGLSFMRLSGFGKDYEMVEARFSEGCRDN